MKLGSIQIGILAIGLLDLSLNISIRLDGFFMVIKVPSMIRKWVYFGRMHEYNH